MSERSPLKLGDVKALMRIARRFRSEAASGGAISDDPAHLRRLLADFCRLLGGRTGANAPAAPAALPILKEVPTRPAATDLEPTLPRRLRQTLARLLAGDSEKQIARYLNLSPHTVHGYVKSLHKRYGVSSRGELLAQFIKLPLRPSTSHGASPLPDRHSPN